jgi:peptide/nickel transport system substrate-binding protein
MKRILVFLSLLYLFVFGLQDSLLAGDTLRATLSTSLNQLFPAKATRGEEYVYDVLVFNGLTQIDEDLNITGDLAERWTSSADLKTWTFYLRKGVKFHHGKELTSEDVIKTFELIADPKTASRVASHAELIERMEAVDRYTVRFTLKMPYAGWADLMVERQLKIVPSDRTDKLSTEPSGTGPFMLKEFTPEDKMVLVKNQNYFIKGQPKLDRIVFRFMPESASRVAALEAGDIDLTWDLPYEAIDKLKKNSNIVVDSVPTSSWEGFVLHNHQKPFDDVRVRRALNLAVDKQKLVDIAVFGHGAPTHSPISPRHSYFNKDIGFKTDIREAKRLLAEAGYPKGFTIKLFVPIGRLVRERNGVAIQQMLKAIDVNAEIQRVPYSNWAATVSGKAPFYTDGYFTRPTVDTSTHPWYHSKGSWNTRMWSYTNPAVDDVLDKTRATKDPAEMLKLYQDFQRLVVENPPGIVIYVTNFVNAYNKKLKGFRTHPYLWLDLRNAYFEK